MNSKRIAHNFLTNLSGGNYQANDIEVISAGIDYSAQQKDLKEYKVAFLFICLNPQYWNLVKPTIEGARKFFLPGHKVDYLLWSDIPKSEDVVSAGSETIKQTYLSNYQGLEITEEKKKEVESRINNSINSAVQSSQFLESDKEIRVFPTEALPWPAGTLYRYHLFLQQEALLREYDYVFYCDIDMKFVNYIGDEILSNLVAAEHPMYSFHKSFWPPYEPNEKSSAYIKRPGQVITDGGQPRFKPFYYAGGFQGGKTEKYIEAMKKTKELIDEDENKNGYRAIWNDESYWNKYLSENQPTLVLSPSFIYPDSLIKEYYEPRWGTSYPPKLITLTKDWSIKPLTAAEQPKIL